MERVNIIHAISDIIENRCKGCKLIDESGAGTDGAKRKKVCDKCQYGIELKSLGDQLSGKRKEKAKVMNEKRGPGRPKKEPMKSVKKEDDYNKLAYELKSNNQRMKQLETELAEKDKLIKLKTEDQAQLMKENGDLRKKNDELTEFMGINEKNYEQSNDLLREELSAYKEKLEHIGTELMNAKADNRKLSKENARLSEYVDSIVEDEQVIEPANDKNREQEVEIEELRRMIECLEKTLMCYMPNGRG